MYFAFMYIDSFGRRPNILITAISLAIIPVKRPTHRVGPNLSRWVVLNKQVIMLKSALRAWENEAMRSSLVNKTLPPFSMRPNWLRIIGAHEVMAFSTMTVILTFVVALLPLPPLAAPMLVVIIPSLVACGLINLTEGKGQVRAQLFRADHWRMPFKWLLITLGLGLVGRLLAWGLALVLNIPAQITPPSPLLVAVIVFAAGEEIGWRGYVLPRLLRSHSALAASLLLAIPWAVLHYALMLPGGMLAGTPPLGHSLFIFSTSVLLAWTYLRSRRSLLAATLLHGWINTPGLITFPGSASAIWILAAAQAVLAIVVVLANRKEFGEIHT
jgi:membrane protease YdiL (CAAX protease family)